MPSSATPARIRRRAVVNGVRRIFPLSLIAGPFGLVYGTTAAENGIGDGSAIAASFLILAGAAQIALVELIADNASWVVGVGTALIINSRMVLYSATLARPFREFPPLWRFTLPHILTDQTAVTAVLEYETEHDPLYRRWFLLGSAVWFFTPWGVGTAVGVLAGGDIPDSWQIGFAVPLMFTALLVPTLRNRPTVVAAVVGGGTAVSTTWLPDGVNIMLGALCGIIAGTAVAEYRAVHPASSADGSGAQNR